MITKESFGPWPKRGGAHGIDGSDHHIHVELVWRTSIWAIELMTGCNEERKPKYIYIYHLRFLQQFCITKELSLQKSKI